MAVPLNPAPDSLGFGSPALGPWFSTDVTLPAPAADLSVSVALTGANDWLPPAAGILSLYISSTPRVAGLAGLRDGNGTAAFANDRVVAHFVLLPEVEERIAALQSVIPSIDGIAPSSGTNTRARIRSFAFEMSEAPSLATLTPRLDFPIAGSTDAEKAENLGLRLNGAALENGTRPMTELMRPGVFMGSRDKILKFGAATTVKLWAFDERGRAVDPGAVAAWWNSLATSAFDNLWAAGISGDERRTAGVAANLTIHMANAHEGALAAALLARLQAANVTPATGSVRARGTGSGAAAFTFSAAPDPDDAPVPRIALLPHGTYRASLDLWTSGPVGGLTRDYARVGVVDVEGHLVGVSRGAPASPTAGQTRRAADQNRASTRVNVARLASDTPLPITRATIDAAVTGCLDVLSGSDPVSMVTSVLDPDWGGLTITLPAAVLPTALPAATFTALTGSGTITGSTVANQRVLAEMTFDSALAGCWVRAWSQGFDFDKGRLFSLDGGGGRIRSDGAVSLVVLLPDGENTARPLGLNVLVASSSASLIYSEIRFDRPIAVAGSPANFTAVSGAIHACEMGEVFASSAAATGNIVSGTTLVARGVPALIDRATIPAAAFVAGTAVRQLAAGDQVILTQPAFRSEVEGASAPALSATATVTRASRSGLTRFTGSGQPLPTQERLEIGLSRVSATEAHAAIASAPALSRYHELLPHQSGHPGAPAAPEHHGTGVVCKGQAAISIAEFIRDRVNATSPALSAAAATPFPVPADPTGAVAWATALRTVAAGTEGEPSLGSDVRNQNYVFGDTFANVRSWFAGRSITIADVSGAANQASAVRALDRRALAAGFGCREAAESLKSTFDRAEDFVYIETPALDDATFGESNDTISPWQALLARMTANLSLRVIVCVPIDPFHGCPAPMKRVRDFKLLAAIHALQSGRESRVVVFSPSAGPRRNLRIASTTVVVDDVYCLTGTTHLWRRGLTFDSSLAIALFDENLVRGRSAEIRRFRQTLLAGRLGMATTLIPDDAPQLLDSIQLMLSRGSIRLTTDIIQRPSPDPTTTDNDIWNRDGSAQTGFNPVQWITDLAATAVLTPEVS